MSKIDTRSTSAKMYDAIKSKSLNVDEIAEIAETNTDYVRVMITRWLRKEVIVRGSHRMGRTTYTAKGAPEVLKTVRARGQVPTLLLMHLRQRWSSALDLVERTGVCEATVRRHLDDMRKKRKVEIDIRENGRFYYRAK